MNGFAVQSEVEAFHLLFLADAQADRELGQQQDDDADDARPQQGDADTFELQDDLARVAVE